jgi:hypothetical protein
MTEPKLIFEISGEKWASGISQQTTFPKGGLFRSATNFNPFENYGMMKPTLAGTQRGEGTITTTPVVSTVIYTGGLPYLYIHTTSKLYQCTLNGTVTDITTASGITTGSIRGAIVWKGKYIYATDTKVIANTIGTSTNTDLLTGLNTCDHVMCIGPDRNLYVTNGHLVAKLTSATGTSGNAADAFNTDDSASYTAGSSMTLRKLLSDGTRLIMLADLNPGGALGIYRSIIGFWDLQVTAANYIQLYDENHFQDNGIIGGEMLDGAVVVFGNNNIYSCSYSTPPRLLRSYSGTGVTTINTPANVFSIIKVKNSIYFGGSSGISAFGSMTGGEQKIFFNPHVAPSGNITCLAYDGSKVYAGTSTPALYDFNSGSTVSEAFISLVRIPFPQPYKLAHIIVVTKTPLVSGENITVAMNSQNGNGVIITSASFTTVGKQTAKFERNPAGISNDREDFREIDYLSISTKATLQSVRIYGYPLPDNDTTL